MSDDAFSEENLALLGGLASRKPRPRRSAAEDEQTEVPAGQEATPSRREDESNDNAPSHSAGMEAEVEESGNETDDAEAPRDEIETTKKITLPSFQLPGLADIRWRTWQNSVVEGLVAVVIAVGLLALGGLWGSEPKEPEPVMPDAEIMIVCPGFAGRPATIMGSVTGQAQISPVSGTGESTWVSGAFEVENITEPMVLTATRGDSSLNARLVIYQAGEADADPPGDRISELNCSQPLASQYLLFPSTSGSIVQLVNPDDTEAVFNLTALASDGAVQLSGLRDLRLAPHSVSRVEVGQMLASPAALTLRVTNTTGRLLATGDVDASLGTEFSTATHLGRNLLITGIPSLPDHTRVMLTNPATVRVTCKIVALYSDGTKEVVGADSLTLEAESTTVFDLTEPLLGAPASLLITANNDVAAGAAVSVANDFAVVPGVPLEQLVERTLLIGVSQPAQLMLANPSEEQIDVEVQWVTEAATVRQSVSVSEGSSLMLDVPEDTKLIRLEAPALLGSALLLGTRETGQATLSLPAETQSAGRTPLRIVAQQP
jgi:hypothetical protein